MGRLTAFSTESRCFRHDFETSGARGLNEPSVGAVFSVSQHESSSTVLPLIDFSAFKSVWYNIFIASLQLLMFFSCIRVMTSLTAEVLNRGKSDFSHHNTDSNPAAMYSGREGINITLTDVWKRTDLRDFLFIFASFGGLARVIVQNSWPIIELFCSGSIKFLSTGGKCSDYVEWV